LRKEYNLKYVWSISIIAALGGLLFGYDWVVISGAKPFYEEFFHLTSTFQIGWAMSSALVGCIFGTIVCGTFSDKYGRKKLLLLAGLLFTFSAVGTAMANTFNTFITYRLLGGIGIGLASNLSPMYIAEIAPAKLRGRFVSVNQLTIVIGILLAQLINWLIANPVPENASPEFILTSWNGQIGWRWMFAAETVPALLFFVCMFFVPESPRWLVKAAKEKNAKLILKKIGGADYANSTFESIKKSLSDEIQQVHFRELFEPKMFKILALGVFIAVFQQWCGINVILYYADEVFSAAGYGVSAMLLNIVIMGAVMLFATFVAIYTVDRWGRRLLLLIGSLGLAITYIFVGLSYMFNAQGIHVLILIISAVAIYSFTLAPIVWVVISEIFPNRIRGAAMSIAVFSLWVGCFTLTYSFPGLNQNLGPSFTFWTYSAICFVGFFVLKSKLPETKGKSLEQIEVELTS
jgi:MFS transporter, SP family, arabinose:H+ symporter